MVKNINPYDCSYTLWANGNDEKRKDNGQIYIAQRAILCYSYIYLTKIAKR